jgi:hypothetical protein
MLVDDMPAKVQLPVRMLTDLSHNTGAVLSSELALQSARAATQS